MTVPFEQQVTLAGQVYFPAMKELKRTVAQRMRVSLTDDELLGVGVFACCKLALETHGAAAFDQVRALADELERNVGGAAG